MIQGMRSNLAICVLCTTITMTMNVNAGMPFEDEIAAFEAADRATPPPSNAVLFVGSSTIRLWPRLREDFPDVALIHRGFGGASFPDVLRYMDRIVTPYRPRKIVLYCGDNDLGNGRSPGQVIRDFEEFVARVRAALPGTPVAFLAVKPSPLRWNLADRMRAVNEKVRAMADADPLLDFVDVFSPMLGPDGKPIPRFYADDGLHMSPEGYALWKGILQPHVR